MEAPSLDSPGGNRFLDYQKKRNAKRMLKKRVLVTVPSVVQIIL